jgi:hypothetical protein
MTARKLRGAPKETNVSISSKGGGETVDTQLLHQRIADRAPEFVAEVFGESAKPAGPGQWRIGRQGSLAVSLKDGRLLFYSHEDDQGGDAIALWQRERGGTAGEALRAVAGWAGVSAEPRERSTPRRPRARRNEIARPLRRKEARPSSSPPGARMSEAGFAEAHAMSRRLASDAALCARLAHARNWQPETLRGLALEGALGWHKGRLAIIYETGIKLRWREGGERRIRFHCGNAGQLWRGWLLTPRVGKVFVTEGETDAITLLDAGAEAEAAGDQAETAGGQTVTAVVALPSATIPLGTVELLAGKDVVLCLDQDPAGCQATAKLEAALTGHARSLRRWRMA